MKKNQNPFSQKDNDTSNEVVSISQLSESLTENALRTDIIRLEKLNVGLSQTIDGMLRTIESKDGEIAHLKSLLLGSAGFLDVASPLLLTDEEMIAVKQLTRLKEISNQRELTLDEVKRLDLLVKNKRLAQGNSTNINGSKADTPLPKNLPNAQLIQIASQKIEEPK